MPSALADFNTMSGAIERLAGYPLTPTVEKHDQAQEFALQGGLLELPVASPVIDGLDRIEVRFAVIVPHTDAVAAQAAAVAAVERTLAAIAQTADDADKGELGEAVRRVECALESLAAESANSEKAHAELTAAVMAAALAGDQKKKAKLRHELASAQALAASVATESNNLREELASAQSRLASAGQRAKAGAASDAETAARRELGAAEEKIAAVVAEQLPTIAKTLATLRHVGGLRF